MRPSIFSRFQKAKRPDLSAPSDSLLDLSDDDAPLVFTHNIDGLDEEERELFHAEASKATDTPVFEGSVEHAYDMALFPDASRCPRCGSETRQQYTDFIYATQAAPRVMFAPAGHFCVKCPSVVIDQELIKAGVDSPRFTYQGVLGIDYGRSKGHDLFSTWNGREAVYVLDEDQIPLGIATFPAERPPSQTPQGSPSKVRDKKKKRQKMAKRSRKANRRK